jgi:membrane-bound ClpP family serine protease
VNPIAARVAYTLSVIFLLLALFALPYTLNNPASFTIDIINIIILLIFIIFIVIRVRQSP